MLESGSFKPQLFKPAWWCPGAHAQTIAGALVRPKGKLAFQRRRLETPDGDFLDLDYLESSHLSSIKSPFLVAVHGLEGSSSSPYIQALLRLAVQRHWSSVAVNMRMCSGEPNRKLQTYHAGKTDDLDLVIKHLVNENPEREIYLVGFSLGGNQVLKWLGEQGSAGLRKVRKAAAISVPYDLAESVKWLDRGFNREVYTRSLLAGLKAKTRMKREKFPDAVRYDIALRANTFTVFDEEVTARVNGFQSANDYWSKSSCQNYLGSIQVPTLLLQAEDDPFLPGKYLPLEVIKANPALDLLLVPNGGHIGFVGGKIKSWLEHTILDYASPKPLDKKDDG